MEVQASEMNVECGILPAGTISLIDCNNDCTQEPTNTVINQQCVDPVDANVGLDNLAFVDEAESPRKDTNEISKAIDGQTNQISDNVHNNNVLQMSSTDETFVFYSENTISSSTPYKPVYSEMERHVELSTNLCDDVVNNNINQVETNDTGKYDSSKPEFSAIDDPWDSDNSDTQRQRVDSSAALLESVKTKLKLKKLRKRSSTSEGPSNSTPNVHSPTTPTISTTTTSGEEEKTESWLKTVSRKNSSSENSESRNVSRQNSSQNSKTSTLVTGEASTPTAIEDGQLEDASTLQTNIDTVRPPLTARMLSEKGRISSAPELNQLAEEPSLKLPPPENTTIDIRSFFTNIGPSKNGIETQQVVRQISYRDPIPDDHFLLSCVVMLCCNVVLGACALGFSLAVNKAYDKKRFKDAKRNSRISLYISLSAILSTFCVAVTLVIVFWPSSSS